MRKRYPAAIAAVLLIAVMAFSACTSGDKTPEPAPAPAPGPAASGSEDTGSGELVAKGYQADQSKDSIVISAVRPETGDNAGYELAGFGPQYKMWADAINSDGGLYVKSLDRKVPIDLQTEDDGSNIDNTKQMFSDIVTGGKADLILAPAGTDSLTAAAPIAQDNGYLLLAAEGGTTEVNDLIAAMKADHDPVNTFTVQNNAVTQIPALVTLFQSLGVSSVYGVYANEMESVGYWSAAEAALAAVNVEITGSEAVDPADYDANAVIANANTSGAQAFVCFAEPAQSVSIIKAAIAKKYNPDIFFVGQGVASEAYSVDAWSDYSQATMNGVMGLGAWSEKSGPAAKAYSDSFRSYWQEKGLFWLNDDGSPNKADGAVYQDWWGDISYYSALQVLQQAVENAGELDDNGMIKNSTLVTYINSGAAFDTALNGALTFTDNRPADDMYAGNIGQWQNGVFEVIDADQHRTADPLFPKPAWKG